MQIRISLLLLAAGGLWAEPVNYEFGAVPGSRITLTVEKTGLWSGRKHVFEFERFNGRVVYDRDTPNQSQVELTIEAASAICKDSWVSEKDRRNILTFMLRDMLDAERHPRLAFKSNAIVLRGERSFDVTGNLAVRGIEKPARVSVTIDDGGGALESVSGQSVVRLKDYGLKPPRAALGTIGTKDEMTVEFQLSTRPAQLSSPAGSDRRESRPRSPRSRGRAPRRSFDCAWSNGCS
jgi:polyisoprenoid-binding protein YceI